MKWSKNYEDRPQSFVKHFFLEKYLEKLAYHILWHHQTLVYVDGFSGPWMSSGENYSDTSFVIALNILRRVHNILKSKHDKDRKVKLLFVEEDDEAFEKLSGYVREIKDFDAQAIQGKFEDHIDSVVEFIGNDFSFSFIDPKGWSGANPSVLEPLLRLEGEVLINFMYDFVNRFLSDERPGVRRSLGSLFPGIEADKELILLEKAGLNREDSIIELYKKAIHAKSGDLNLSLVTSMAVKNRRAERTHFHLVYRTRNWKGIQKFREAERETIGIQDVARKSAMLADKQRATKQPELFDDAPVLPDQAAIERERQPRLIQGKRVLNRILRSTDRISYGEVAAAVLSTPMVFEKDLRDWLQSAYRDEQIKIEGLRGSSTRPNEKSVIVTSPH